MKDKKPRAHPVLPRTNLNSSRLIRVLADLALIDGAQSSQSFAQEMGQWVGFTDSATLYAALNSGAAQAAAEPSRAQAGEKSPAFSAASDALTRVRSTLTDSITASCSATPGGGRIKFPAPESGNAPETAVIYAPFHRFYLALQREMDAAVGPLRATVRQALAATSPALRQLATLDAAFDGILGERERRLFSTVPRLLEKRFQQLLLTQQQTLVYAGQTDEAAARRPPDIWLVTFRDELREVLLAELDVRLQPVMGLIEAFGNKVNGQT